MITSTAGKVTPISGTCVYLSGIRSFFNEQGFLEVETPIRSPAIAPEKENHFPWKVTVGFFLRLPELYMKRLLAAGYDKNLSVSVTVSVKASAAIITIPNFNAAGVVPAKRDYEQMMRDTEGIVTARCARRSVWAPLSVTEINLSTCHCRGKPELTVSKSF